MSDRESRLRDRYEFYLVNLKEPYAMLRAIAEELDRFAPGDEAPLHIQLRDLCARLDAMSELDRARFLGALRILYPEKRP